MVLVFDGKSVLYRLYYGNSRCDLWSMFNNFFSKTTAMVPKITACVFAWEEGRSFRSNLFPVYKAHRKEIPVPLKLQLASVEKRLRDSSSRNTLLFCQEPLFEGDDILGSCAYHAVLDGQECALVTSDKDCDQLIGDGVFVLRPWEARPWFDADEVKGEWGLAPASIPHYMAIAGDASDGIPGVKGIGDKGAMELVCKHGSVDAMFRYVNGTPHDQLDPLHRKLWGKGNEQLARLCLQLATIRTDALASPPWR